MRVSTSTGICGTVLQNHKMYFSCEDAIRAVAAAGFDAIDLNLAGYGREGLPLAQPDWRDWVKRQKENCDAAGLPITQAHAHYYLSWHARNFTALEWEENNGKLFRDIEAAGILGVPWLVFHPDTGYDSAGYSRRLSLEVETERFRRLGEAAAGYGVGIAIENMRDIKNGPRCAEKFFGTTVEDLLELLDRLGDDRLFGICWDTGHANLCGISQPDAIRQIGKRLKALHINDNRGEKDDHTLPCLGTVEWEPILLALKEVGYAGDFTYECKSFTADFDPQMNLEAMKFACYVARRMTAVIEER